MDADEPVRAARELDHVVAGAAFVEPTERVEAERVVELIGAEPLVEGANQIVLVGERHWLIIR